MNKLNEKSHQDNKIANIKNIDSLSLYLRTVNGIVQDEVHHKSDDVFADYDEYKSLTITQMIVFRYSHSRFISEAQLSCTVIDLRKLIMEAMVERFPVLHSEFKDGFEYDSFENPIRAPFDVLNINEINLDGEAVLHSFIVLDHVFAEMNPTAEAELYRILQKACAKLLQDDEFMDECSLSFVTNPAAALKPCFKRYEDKVFRICGF